MLISLVVINEIHTFYWHGRVEITMGGLGDNMKSGISTSLVRMHLSFGQTWLSNEEQRRILHLSDEAPRWQCNITLLFPTANFIKTLTCL